MSFKRNRNVIALALANLKEQRQYARKGVSLQTNHTRQHTLPLSHGQGGSGCREMREDGGEEGEGVELTESEVDFITGA